MRLLLAIILAVSALFAIGYSASKRLPFTKSEDISVSFTRAETRTRTVRQTVEVRGENVEVDVEVPYTVNVPYTETRQRTTVPNALQKLQFWFILAVGLFFGAYVLFVFALWIRDKLIHRKASRDTRDTELRVDSVIKMASGILLGFLGTVNIADSTASSQNDLDAIEKHPNAAVQGGDQFSASPRPADTNQKH